MYKVVSDSIVGPTCLGSCDGTLRLYILDGVPPYTADLLNNQNGSLLSYSVHGDTLVTGVCTGDYTVTITDANGCDASLILGGSNQAVLNTSINTDVVVDAQAVDCHGAATGAVHVSTTPIPAYLYTWLDLNGDTISTTASASNLTAGDYILHSSYNNITGCTTFDTVTVSQSSLIHSTGIITNVSCNGDSDGVIVVTTTLGGVSPYVYSWSPISSLTDSLLDSVMAGVYDLTILDANGCSVTDSYTITEPDLLVATVTATQTYILNTSLVGGTAPYSYSWEEQSQPGVSLGTFDTYTVGSYGTYYVIVTDSNDCEAVSNTIVYNEGPLGTISLNKDINLHVYPNPFREETTVDFGQRIANSTIRIVDVYGKLLESYEISDTDKYIITRNNKASGVYFLEIEIDQQYLHNIKLVVE